MADQNKIDTLSPANMSPEWVQQYRENRWLGLGDTSQMRIVNPFSIRTQYDIENPHIYLLDLMRKPENFGFTCQILFNKTLAPFQLAILRELWVRPFPMLIGSRGMGKSWILACYIMLRAMFDQGSKIVICGAAFRQAKVVFDYCQDLWENGPVYRDITGKDKRNGPRRDVDRCSLRVGDSIIVALPLGDGTKIRGQRANIIIADEFASITKQIFETVIRGFAAVSLSPVEKYQQEMKDVALKEVGLWNDQMGALAEESLISNQTVISGTAYYSWNHFYDYWKQYRAIVRSKGDKGKLREIFAGNVPEKFNYKDYSVIRVPVKMLPPGFMDEKQVAQAKATVHIGTYQMEYGAVFATDSNGFFKRSLIEGCVVGGNKEIDHPSCGRIRTFLPALKGNPQRKHVLAVDPASESDNFSLVVLECWPDHRRIKYVWTTTRQRFKAKVKRGLAEDGDFYGYAARKIRDTMRDFPCDRIALDSQGGGIAVLEALQDKTRLKEGERPLLPTIDPDNEKPTDDLPGNHCIEVIQFARADWVSEANHGLRKDFEDKALLFPEFDTAQLALSLEDDKDSGRIKVDTEGRVDRVDNLYDTIDDCVSEIEELKDELATIVHTQTGTSMRDRWDTPETKTAGGKKGRLRKDRYSALLMANSVARNLARVPVVNDKEAFGGFAHVLGKETNSGAAADGPMWIGPAWFTDATGSESTGAGAVVERRRR